MGALQLLLSLSLSLLSVGDFIFRKYYPILSSGARGSRYRIGISDMAGLSLHSIYDNSLRTIFLDLLNESIWKIGIYVVWG